MLVFQYYMRDRLPVVVNVYDVKGKAEPGKALEVQLTRLKRLWFAKVRNPGDDDTDTLQPYLDTYYSAAKIGRTSRGIRDLKLYSLASGTPPNGNACRGDRAG